METLYERIMNWKNRNEWESIQEVFSTATTLDWYYQIVTYVQENKAKYRHRYREKILEEEAFIEKFGCYDLEYLKKAQKVMNKKCYKWH